jgi:hypothetical protein
MFFLTKILAKKVNSLSKRPSKAPAIAEYARKLTDQLLGNVPPVQETNYGERDDSDCNSCNQDRDDLHGDVFPDIDTDYSSDHENYGYYDDEKDGHEDEEDLQEDAPQQKEVNVNDLIRIVAEQVRAQALRDGNDPLAGAALDIANMILGQSEPEVDEEVEGDEYEEGLTQEDYEFGSQITSRTWKKAIFKNINQSTLSNFQKYHAEHPWIFEAFANLANQTRDSGLEEYSAKCLMEVLRWNESSAGRTFKINNSYTSLQARLLIAIDPSFKKFFKLRVIVGLSRAS